MAPLNLENLSAEQLRELQGALTPKWNKYIPIVPTAKQTAALLMTNVKELLYGGAAGGGKALALSTPILTANRGWQTMETVQVGDFVFGRDGIPTPVLAKSPVFYDHDCYEVVFDGGASLVADAGHLWQVDMHNKRYTNEVCTTKELADRCAQRNRTVDAVKKRNMLQYPEKQLPCHPYALGVWLGDGCTRSGGISARDEQIHRQLEQLGYALYRQPGDPHSVFSKKLNSDLRSLGFLGTGYQGALPKFIPTQYLEASPGQRLMLLWGLMDTDGNASSDKGYCSICMVNRELMEQIADLVRSLGIKVRLRESIATCTQTGAQMPKYNLKWSTPMPMFTLEYKLARQKRNGFRGTQQYHYFKAFYKVPTVPVQCITVGNAEHMYLAGKELIPTHNSVYLLAAALQYVDCPGYSAILFRKTFSDLMLPGALIPMSQEWLQPFIKRGEVKWQDKEKRYTFMESGATLSFGYLDARGDELRYQGAQFQFVGMDECTHIAPEAYRYLFSRMRRTKDIQGDIPLRFRAACNPGGQFGDYYYDRFFVDNLDENGKPRRFFLQAGLKDNPHLDAEAYREALAELDPITRAQLEDGNWEIRPKGDLFDKGWILPINYLEIPAHTRWVRFWDLAAIDPKYRKNKHNKQAPDWTIGFKLGMADGCYYVGDIIKVQKSPGDLEELIYNTAVADGYGCAIRMEEEGGSSGIANTERYARNVLQGFDFAGVKPVVSKIERARPVAAACQVGSVFLSNRCRNVTDFYAQLEAFPNGANDDIIDGFSGAFAYFKPKIGNMAPPSKTPWRVKVAKEETRSHFRPLGLSGSYWLNNMTR